nr:hypothetical protein Itr_chr06CG22190 [Ipomoea trifida]
MMFKQKCNIPISCIQICISIVYKSNRIFFQFAYKSYILNLYTVFLATKENCKKKKFFQSKTVYAFIVIFLQTHHILINFGFFKE